MQLKCAFYKKCRKNALITALKVYFKCILVKSAFFFEKDAVPVEFETGESSAVLQIVIEVKEQITIKN